MPIKSFYIEKRKPSIPSLKQCFSYFDNNLKIKIKAVLGKNESNTNVVRKHKINFPFRYGTLFFVCICINLI